MVNKIDWNKADRITEPGRYMLAFGWLTVTADDIAIWQRYPGAAFTLVEGPSLFDAPDDTEYHLGTFELSGAQSCSPCSVSGGVAS
ncbi:MULTISPECIES: hypothetical protein [unclassified Bradyrhizobium]|uniref:hypothetical protein n=1 Tax=unclassified Bradyrhizobium TaxID=2631580 RepID=UPI0028E420F7|nr:MULTISPECIES: hypothetical protein [unclassified Bradyrhizobium]